MKLDSFVSILYDKGLITTNKFSLCFAKNGGYFTIGEINATYHNQNDNIKYIPYENKRNLYAIKLNDIQVNKKDNFISNEYFTIIDSGTTVSYIPLELYDKIKLQIREFCSKDNDNNNKNKCLGDINESEMGICFKLNSNVEYSKFEESMPNLNFVFENNVTYDWNPGSYLFNNTETYDRIQSYCMGFIKWE
jgi:hypothetical protein